MSQPTVLVVDDSPGIRKTLIMSLEAMGLKAVAASSGIEALNYLEAYPTLRLVLLDVNMPHLNGFDAAKLMAQRKYPDLKICIVSGDLQEEDIVKAAQNGLVDFLVKPVTYDVLQQKVTSMLMDKPKHMLVREAYFAALTTGQAEPDLRVTHLNKAAFTIHSSAGFSEGSKIVFQCKDLQKLLGFEDPLQGTVSSCIRLEGFGNFRLEIIPENLSEFATKKLEDLIAQFG